MVAQRLRVDFPLVLLSCLPSEYMPSDCRWSLLDPRQATSAWAGPKGNGAKGNSGPNGFYGGGESEKEKLALLNKGGKSPLGRLWSDGLPATP